MIAEAENTIKRNSGVRNVYTFLHTYFEGVEFYAARRYIHFTKEGIYEDLFVNYEEEEYEDEVMSVSLTTLLVEKKLVLLNFLIYHVRLREKFEPHFL